MMVQRIARCRICGNKNLVTVVDLGEQCLSGQFPKIGHPGPSVVPLELVQCTGGCGLVQLAHEVPLELMYNEGYGYLSGLNPSMKKHLESIAHAAESLVKLHKSDVAIDVGSNDGTLLKAYVNKDVIRVGFDAPHYKKYYDGSGIVFTPSFFNGYVFKANIITSIAMFYDLPDPNQFVNDIKNTLHPDGVWILEQSYLPSMLKMNAFDTICHEHLEYYCVKQIKWLCDKHDLKIFHYELNDSNGGSIRVFVCHKDSERRGIGDTTEVHLDFQGFNKRIQDIKRRVTGFLREEYRLGKSIHLYGASTKGNVLLQFFDIDRTIIDMAFDKNTGKNGHQTPGTHIPISPMHGAPDYYLVLPWHFREQFIKQEREYLMNGGRMVFPLPWPEVVSMENDKIVCRPIQ